MFINKIYFENKYRRKVSTMLFRLRVISDLMNRRLRHRMTRLKLRSAENCLKAAAIEIA